jgi:hypothetical protein
VAGPPVPDERPVDYRAHLDAGDVEGLPLGRELPGVYSGFTLLSEAAEAAEWEIEIEIGVPFNEVHLEPNGHELELVFSDLFVTRVDARFSLFAMPPYAPAWPRQATPGRRSRSRSEG